MIIMDRMPNLRTVRCLNFTLCVAVPSGSEAAWFRLILGGASIFRIHTEPRPADSPDAVHLLYWRSQILEWTLGHHYNGLCTAHLHRNQTRVLKFSSTFKFSHVLGLFICPARAPAGWWTAGCLPGHFVQILMRTVMEKPPHVTDTD